MNFDTRTILDVIKLNEDLKEKLCNIIDIELINRKYYDTDEAFAQDISPLIQGYLVRFMKNDMKKSDLLFVKKLINLKNVDYKTLIDVIVKY